MTEDPMTVAFEEYREKVDHVQKHCACWEAAWKASRVYHNRAFTPVGDAAAHVVSRITKTSHPVPRFVAIAAQELDAVIKEYYGRSDETCVPCYPHPDHLPGECNYCHCEGV